MKQMSYLVQYFLKALFQKCASVFPFLGKWIVLVISIKENLDQGEFFWINIPFACVLPNPRPLHQMHHWPIYFLTPPSPFSSHLQNHNCFPHLLCVRPLMRYYSTIKDRFGRMLIPGCCPTKLLCLSAIFSVVCKFLSTLFLTDIVQKSDGKLWL